MRGAARMQAMVPRSELVAAQSDAKAAREEAGALAKDLEWAKGQLARAQEQVKASRSEVEQLQVGNYVNAAQPLFSLGSPRMWIDATLKEDQLAHVRPGQPATVEVDAHKGVTYHGRVASVSPGTGSSFALLPPENATGNWVKVVQRVTVRVELDEQDLKDHPLQAGLSARVKIDTKPPGGGTGSGAAARP